ncbi:unnamed protein product [Rhodiola kirilowii]
MVPGTKDSNQAIAPLSAEDEVTKRNTDCVYFLASPLTCKKGSECEYRHSEHARVNPRDCWYWLNGSCLNPKCAFRHPPLDGLLGSQPTATAGTALLLPQAVTPSPLAVPQSKQTVPCIFFQKGVCLKGDKCAFLHGPNSVPTKPPHATPAAEVTSTKNVFGVPQRSAQESKRYQPNISNSNKFADDKLNSKTSNSQPKANAANRVVLPSTEFNASFKSSTIGSNGMHQAEMFDDHVMRNGKDADDLYRESSPGFDVLVDDEVAEDQYYDADEYGTRGAHEGRSVNDYGALPDADLEMLHDPRGYDGYDRLSGQYARDQNRRASEKILRGTVSIEGRDNRKGGSSDRIGQSDLRHRLKQMKGSGLRSVISDNYEQRRSDDSRRDSRLVAPLESSMSSRLQGRIKDPRRSPVRSSISDRDIERGRNRSRTSPIRTQIRDRMGSRGQDDFGNRRSLRGYGMQREGSADGLVEFSGPKTLSELKTCKSSVKDRLISGQESFSLGKRKSTGEREQFDSSLSFEGPKPLSEILKRKKSAEMNAPESGSTENKETNKTESAENTGIIKEELKSVSEMKIEPDNILPSETLNSNQIDQDMGITGGEGMEDPNLEGYDQGEDGEEYYYEEDGGEYDLEEGENAEGEYVDEEDGEDFQKKIGGMFS